MHEYKIQEKLTTKKIEYDLKKAYGRGALIGSLISAFIIAMFLTFVILIDKIASKYADKVPAESESGPEPVLIIIYVLVSLVFLVLLCICVYEIYMRLAGYKKFKIGIDTFTGFEVRRGWGTYSSDVENNNNIDNGAYVQYFKFARFGRFAVGEKTWYYTWSEHYKTYGHELEDSFRTGERAYVVLVGKRIQCVYNDKMFDLSETLIRERLMDDTELHKLQKQSEQEEDKQ